MIGENEQRCVKFIKVLWAIVFISMWEVSVMSGLINPLMLPRFSDVVKRLGVGLVDGTIGIQFLQSIGMILLGLVISLLLTLIMVYLDYFYTVFRALFELLASVFHPLPGIAILPVVMIWFGIGPDAVLFVIIHAAVWSMYLSVKRGFDNIDPSLIDAAYNNGANKLQLYRHVLLTCAFSDVLSGLQIGWARGWRGLISAEMVFGAISALGGIGWFMYERRSFMDTTGMYAGILLVALVGILVDDLLFSHFLSRWYRSE